MSKFVTSGNKIENVKKGSGPNFRFAEMEFLDTKAICRKAFIKNKSSGAKERRKEQLSQLNANKKMYNKKKIRGYVHQAALFEDSTDRIKIYNAVESLVKDLAINLTGKFRSKDFVATITTKVCSILSSMRLMKGEKDPVKIISILTLTVNSMMPGRSEKLILNMLTYSTELIQYFKDRFGFVPYEQQALFEDYDLKKIEWIKDLPNMVDNWEAARQSPAFSKVSELISVMATMGMIDQDKLTISVKGLELFRLANVRKHANVNDLLSAILSTIEYFVSGGYEFFLTGNPRRFLFEDSDASEFDDLYNMLLEATPHAQAMNLAIMQVTYKGEVTVISDDEYYSKILTCIDLCGKCKQLAKNTWQKSYFTTRLERLISWKAEFNARRCHGKFRIQALSFFLLGESGTGKSTLTPAIVTSMLKYMGVPDKELQNIAYINECDPYDSTITGNSHCFVYDDIGNTKKDFMKEAPTRKIIDHNNNAPLMANKADLEGKGVTPIRPKLNIYTSNVGIDVIARTYSNCPESQIRRMIVNVELSVKKEYCIPGETRMDGAKVAADFPDDPFPDVFEIYIYKASKITQTGVAPVAYDGTPKLSKQEAHMFSISEFMNYCYSVCDNHMSVQNRLKEMNDTIVDKCSFCAECKRADKFCICEPKVEEIPCISNMLPPQLVEEETSEVSFNDNCAVNIDNSKSDFESLQFEQQASIRRRKRKEEFLRNQKDTLNEWFSDDDGVSSEDKLLLEELSEVNANGFANNSNFDFDENVPYEIQSRKLALWNIIPGTKIAEQTDVFHARFADLVKFMEFVPAMWLNFGDIMIAKWFNHPYVRRLYWVIWSHKLTKHLQNIFVFAFLVDMAVLSVLYALIPFHKLFVTLAMLLQGFLSCVIISLVTKWYRDRMNLLDRLRDSTRQTYREIRSWNWRWFAKYAFAFIAGYKILKVAQKLIYVKKTMSNIYNQATINPTSIKDIEERDAQESDWAKPEIEEVYVDNRSKTTTLEQMERRISGNLYHVRFRSVKTGKCNECDAIAIKGNAILIPAHAFTKEETDFQVTCRKKEGDGLNTIYKGYIGIQDAGVIPGLDLVLVNCTFLPPHYDISHYFPEKLTINHGGGHFLYRQDDGKLRNDTIGFTRVQNYAGGAGYAYQTPYNTFNGLCMGVLIGIFRTPCIVSFHNMGRPDTRYGVGLHIDRSQLEKLVTNLESKCLSAHSNGTLPSSIYGRNLLERTESIHANSSLRYLPKQSKCKYFGESSGRVSHAKTSVIQTKIHDSLERHLGISRSYSGPKFRKHMWGDAMRLSTNPSVGFEIRILNLAAQDKTRDLVNHFNKPGIREIVRKELRPLSGNAIWDGVDGERFKDRVPTNTSKGYPLTGPKEEWVTRLEPNETHMCPTEIRDEVLQEMTRMETELLAGRRCYTIFKACVKDEVVEASCEKVRVFTACQWAYLLLTRKYFLSLGRLLSLFPTISEMAVGINAHGPEWDEMSTYITTFGEDRILAGDYSKFDLRMPAQVLMKSYEVFINVCEACGTYTNDDIKIMKGIATEMSYSMVAYNGDMIEHCGSHPSGNSMTVYANCMDNCLNFRCAYYALSLREGTPLDEIPAFRDVCALMTYGDDAKSSVSRNCDYFNIKSYAGYLAEHDIKFTMPDKKSELVEYMHDSDADFLKRKNVYNPDTGLLHGALDMNSIWKSLFAVMKSDIGVDAQTSQNLVGACRELFHHGRQVFNEYHPKLVAVADDAKLTSFSERVIDGRILNPLLEDYETRLQAFKTKHDL